MERLPKFAIYLAIGIGISFFVIFLYAILPHLIDNVSNEWKRVLDDSAAGKNRAELEKMFREHPAYIMFTEKYPDAGEYFRDRGNGNGRMELTAMNFTSYNKIMLEMNYDKRDDNLYLEATCENEAADFRLRIHGDYSTKFIEMSNCLDISRPTAPELIPEPDVLCRNGAVSIDGVCVVN